MAGSKQTVVAFLTLSSNSSVDDFVNSIADDLNEHTCKYVQLRDELKPFDVRRSQEYDAVVLLHSVQEGRNAITDVPDAKYDKLLPQLKKVYGAGRVAVIVYSMPSLQQSYNKDAMMLVFRDSQPTTFECSKCVIQCNNLHEMDIADKRILKVFLNDVPNSPLPKSQMETAEPSTEKDVEVKGEENNDNAVKLLYHSGPGNSDTSELSKYLKTQFTGYTFESLNTDSEEIIHHFKTILVLVDKKELANDDTVAKVTAVYSTKIEPEHLSWLIMGKTVESNCNELPRIFKYTREHEQYIFEKSTLNDMKEWFTQECRLDSEPKTSSINRFGSFCSIN